MGCRLAAVRPGRSRRCPLRRPTPRRRELFQAYHALKATLARTEAVAGRPTPAAGAGARASAVGVGPAMVSASAASEGAGASSAVAEAADAEALALASFRGIVGAAPPDAELRRRLRAADGCVQTAANAFFEAAPSAAAAGSGGAAGGAGASGASAGAAGPSELRAAEQGGRCCVCLEAESTHAFVPCGHQCVCATCGALVRSKAPRHACCPLCKLPSKSLMRVFRT
jgi:hypothetical protein